ncbi:hypothetical protein BDZ94DRAFT_1203813 [Collybia nuda]|uniref:AAA+ ATPase domain-containing protein n=1 Tax=Collybia nuda TaxID=64659 RepID=A0A9P6C956_9AGAR|nr:hypothetical protein BDZ94DRAFT_1203813 [Collybia nuda]
MRSQALFRRSKSFLKSSPAIHYSPSLSNAVRPLRLSRKEQPSRLFNRVPSRRLVSSTSDDLSNPSETPGGPSTDPGASNGSEPPADVLDKPKSRRTKISVAGGVKDIESVQLPEDLDIIWTPETEPPNSHNLPPPEIFEDALNNLLISLHPQTQHRAAYASPLGPPTEPTLSLYCPIEGGEYVIDATVRELARRTGAEVLVLDAVQLAAGEWGHFGTAANSLSLPRNPLHFTSSSTLPPHNSRALPDEDDESDSHSQFFSPPQQMTLTVMTPPTVQGRAILTSSRRAPPNKVKVFFDALVNIPPKLDPSSSSPSAKSKPRLVYIRDFPTLAPVSSAWYPPLLSAVRERRRGPISRPSSPVGNPITIIFGITPPLTPPVNQGPPNNGLMNILMSRSSTISVSGGVGAGNFDWGEGESAEKARERRLRDRLKKWEKGDTALYEDLPRLSNAREDENATERPEIIVIGGNNGVTGFPPMIGAGAPPSSNGQSESSNNSPFFRTSTLIPSLRSPVEEQKTRMARRREINELTLRMGIGAAGGVLSQEGGQIVHSTDLHNAGLSYGTMEGTVSETDGAHMWGDWGTHVEVWSNVRQIADRAIGSTLSAAAVSSSPEDITLDPTAVSWSVVHKAWAAHRSSKDLRKSWLKDSSSYGKATKEHGEAKENTREDQDKVDEVIERVRNEDLDPHEQRLLSCIVDSVSMPTSFDQVHLPPHTIDSVRTIVSLPLLHPQAFQQGILKEHGMTGCLLFGPPGTGKTLVVRALAKEAGCRMMTISPSDVMDMYVGEGEKLVKAVFSLARRLSPCVVFLDEIDALFGARMSGRESGGAFAHRGVITEFMQEMDGLKSSKEDSVIIIGATNRPFDLDDAVLRRLPRRLLVDLPGEREREGLSYTFKRHMGLGLTSQLSEILKILLREENLAADLDIRALATQTESFSGSDLKHLCVSAALDAVKENIVLPWSKTPSSNRKPISVSAVAEPSILRVRDDPSSLSGGSPGTPRGLPIGVMTPTSLDILSSNPEPSIRTLRLHNFTKALKEITPSSSEALGSLTDLRKWNDEFGEGGRDQKRRQVWGKGNFGFTDKKNRTEGEGRVLRSSFSNFSF